MYNHKTAKYWYNMKNKTVDVHQVQALEAPPQMPPYMDRGRGRYCRRGQGKMNNKNREREYECFYCQTPSHMSRDCPMRIRHQVEKRGGLDGPNNGLEDQVQMIICGQNEDLEESDAQVMADLLAITRSQKGKIKMLLETSS